MASGARRSAVAVPVAIRAALAVRLDRRRTRGRLRIVCIVLLLAPPREDDIWTDGRGGVAGVDRLEGRTAPRQQAIPEGAQPVRGETPGGDAGASQPADPPLAALVEDGGPPVVAGRGEGGVEPRPQGSQGRRCRDRPPAAIGRGDD